MAEVILLPNLRKSQGIIRHIQKNPYYISNSSIDFHITAMTTSDILKMLLINLVREITLLIQNILFSPLQLINKGIFRE